VKFGMVVEIIFISIQVIFSDLLNKIKAWMKIFG